MRFSICLHSTKAIAYPGESCPDYQFRWLGELIALVIMAVGLSHNAFAGMAASTLGSVKNPTRTMIFGAMEMGSTLPGLASRGV
jgi:hypothetical protein